MMKYKTMHMPWCRSLRRYVPDRYLPRAWRASTEEEEHEQRIQQCRAADKYWDVRESDFVWFVENYDDLFAQYGVGHLAISNKTVFGSYQTDADAFEAMSASRPAGSFIIQYCNGDKWSCIESFGGMWEVPEWPVVDKIVDAVKRVFRREKS